MYFRIGLPGPFSIGFNVKPPKASHKRIFIRRPYEEVVGAFRAGSVEGWRLTGADDSTAIISRRLTTILIDRVEGGIVVRRGNHPLTVVLLVLSIMSVLVLCLNGLT